MGKIVFQNPRLVCARDEAHFRQGPQHLPSTSWYDTTMVSYYSFLIVYTLLVCLFMALLPRHSLEIWLLHIGVLSGVGLQRWGFIRSFAEERERELTEGRRA